MAIGAALLIWNAYDSFTEPPGGEMIEDYTQELDDLMDEMDDDGGDDGGGDDGGEKGS